MILVADTIVAFAGRNMSRTSKSGFAPQERAGGAWGADALEGLGRNSRVWVQTQDSDGNDEWSSGALGVSNVSGTCRYAHTLHHELTK